MHINVAHILIKQSFPELGELQNVLVNNKMPLENPETNAVQILHVNSNLWDAISCINNGMQKQLSCKKEPQPSKVESCLKDEHMVWLVRGDIWMRPRLNKY